MKNSNWDFWIDHTSLLENRKEESDRIPKRYYFIFNAYTNEIEYFSNSFYEITGHPLATNMMEILSYIHPDDTEYCMACEKKIILFLNQLYFEDNFSFSSKYSFRIKTAAGKYIPIMQRHQPLEVNSMGFASKSLVFHELLPENFVREEDDFLIYDRVKNRPVISKNIYNLTKREWEIVDLIVEGASTKEISTIMNVSEHTIRTHRKNILHKTNSSNFLELTKKMILNN